MFSYKEYLKTLSRGQRKYLGKFQCGLCDHPLDRDGCSAIYERPCTIETRISRAGKCLENYKPRTNRGAK